MSKYEQFLQQPGALLCKHVTSIGAVPRRMDIFYSIVGHNLDETKTCSLNPLDILREPFGSVLPSVLECTIPENLQTLNRFSFRGASSWNCGIHQQTNQYYN